ncbi:MAG: hypothetical protein AB3N64_14900, partial [Puniceicoccaceae bacterium]
MNIQPTLPRKSYGLLILLPLIISPAFGQDDSDTDPEVFDLSPFEVKAADGWVANETLAGSRLRTEYRDLAGQYETLTMQFMEDFAVNSPEEAAIYSQNIESREEYVDGNGIMDDLSGQLRIRGLTQPTNSVNFFSTGVPGDNFNIERLTIASGPNSILFGTGSPSGIIDRTLKKAEMNDFGDIFIQADSFNGYRGQLDLNKEIIEGKFAIRLATVYEDKRWDIQQAKEIDKRVYGTATIK